MDRLELKTRLEAEVESLREALVESTSRILQFETVSGAADEEGRERFRQALGECARYLESLADAMGFRFVADEAGRWFSIEWPAEGAAGEAPATVIGVPTHIDVVPAGGQWTHPPFAGVVADGLIWGRGTQDDKGPLVAVLYGLHALRRLGFRPPATIRLLVGTQEEIGDWSDIQDCLRHLGIPDFGFTPDANFPIIIGEKGMINLEAEAKWAAASPNGPVEFVALEGGARANVVPDLCELKLRYPTAEREAIVRELYEATGRFTADTLGASITLLPEKARDVGDGHEEILVSFLGKSAHGSTPEKGHNAALDALQFVAETETFSAPLRNTARFLHFACSDLLGGRLGIASTHDFMGPTTVNLGIVRLGPTGGRATINVRATLGMDRREVIRRVGALGRTYGQKAGIELAITGEERGFNAHYLDPEKAGQFLSGLQDGFEAVTSELPELKSIGGTTYAKAMPNCCAFGPVLLSAGEEELAHQADERISVEAQVRNAKIYGLALAYATLNLTPPSDKK